jgi:hypothetical protein
MTYVILAFKGHLLGSIQSSRAYAVDFSILYYEFRIQGLLVELWLGLTSFPYHHCC